MRFDRLPPLARLACARLRRLCAPRASTLFVVAPLSMNRFPLTVLALLLGEALQLEGVALGLRAVIFDGECTELQCAGGLKREALLLANEAREYRQAMKLIAGMRLHRLQTCESAVPSLRMK